MYIRLFFLALLIYGKSLNAMQAALKAIYAKDYSQSQQQEFKPLTHDVNILFADEVQRLVSKEDASHFKTIVNFFQETECDAHTVIPLNIKSTHFNAIVQGICNNTSLNSYNIEQLMELAHAADMLDEHSEHEQQTIHQQAISKIVKLLPQQFPKRQDLVNNPQLVRHYSDVLSQNNSNRVYCLEQMSMTSPALREELSASLMNEIQPIICRTDRINALAFSPDNKKIAFAPDCQGARHKVYLWDIATQKVTKKFIGHTSDINSLAFNSAGTRIVAGSDQGNLHLWDSATGNTLFTVSDTGIVKLVALSPNDSYIASVLHPTGLMDTVSIWNTTSDIPITSITGLLRTACMTFSPESSRIATASFYNVRVYDILTGNQLLSFVRNTVLGCASAKAVTFTHSNYIIAAYPDGVYIWDATTGTNIGECLKMSDCRQLVSVIFSPNNRYISTLSRYYYIGTGSNANTKNIIRVWDAHKGIYLFSFVRNQNHIKAVTFSADSTQLAIAVDNGTIQLWNIEDLNQKIRDCFGSLSLEQWLIIREAYCQRGQDGNPIPLTTEQRAAFAAIESAELKKLVASGIENGQTLIN